MKFLVFFLNAFLLLSFLVGAQSSGEVVDILSSYYSIPGLDQLVCKDETHTYEAGLIDVTSYYCLKNRAQYPNVYSNQAYDASKRTDAEIGVKSIKFKGKFANVIIGHLQARDSYWKTKAEHNTDNKIYVDSSMIEYIVPDWTRRVTYIETDLNTGDGVMKNRYTLAKYVRCHIQEKTCEFTIESIKPIGSPKPDLDTYLPEYGFGGRAGFGEGARSHDYLNAEEALMDNYFYYPNIVSEEFHTMIGQDSANILMGSERTEYEFAFMFFSPVFDEIFSKSHQRGDHSGSRYFHRFFLNK